MVKKIAFVVIPMALIAIVYALGPRPEKPLMNMQMSAVPAEAEALEKYINDQEGKHKLKPENQARIIWAVSTKAKTEYSIVYLHGFSASNM